MIIRKTHKLIALVAIVAVSFAFRGAAPANFAGTWKLNENKSEFGPFGSQGATGKVVIEQKEEAVSIASTSSASGSDVTTTSSYADGKDVENEVGPMKRKANLKWADDKQSFVISFTLSGQFGGQSFEMKGTETWSLSSDGKNATQAIAMSTPQGEINIKMVYDKQ